MIAIIRRAFNALPPFLIVVTILSCQPEQQEKQGYKILFPASNNGSWGLIDSIGRVVIDFKYDSIFYSANGIVSFKKDGLWGCMDTLENIKIQSAFDDLREFDEGFAVFGRNGKYGIIDSLGNVVFKPTYENVGMVRNGITFVKDRKKFALASYNGKLLTAFDYDTIGLLKNGRIIAEKNNKYFVLDRGGSELNKIGYDYTGDEEKIEMVISINKRYGIIDTNMRFIVNPVYEEISSTFFDGRAAFKRGKKWGFLDINGSEVIPPEYDGVRNFYSGTAAVKKGGKWALIDINGTNITDFIYNDVGDFSEGLAYFVLDNKVGFLNTRGQVAIPNKFREDENKLYSIVSKFKKGITAVHVGSKLNLIDTNGTLLLKSNYDFVTPLENSSLAIAVKNDKAAYITKTGDFLFAAPMPESHFWYTLGKILSEFLKKRQGTLHKNYYSERDEETLNFDENLSESQYSTTTLLNERKCYSCSGSGRCRKCSQTFRVHYWGGKYSGWQDRNETRPGQIMCTTCRGAGVIYGSHSQGQDPSTRPCSVSGCKGGWLNCSDCNYYGRGRNIGQCSRCNGKGVES